MSLTTYEYKENKSFLIPFFCEFFSNLELKIQPLVKSFATAQKRNLESDAERARDNLIGVIINSPLVQLFTGGKLKEPALWVLFRDTFVYLMMAKTEFVDFASNTNPFDGIIEAYQELMDGNNQFSKSIEEEEDLIPENPPQKSDKNLEVFEDDLVFNEGMVKHQRPGLLYLVEALAFNIMRARRSSPDFAKLDSSDFIFKVLSDMIIQMSVNKGSLNSLASLLDFVPVQSKLFHRLAQSLSTLSIDEHFFSANTLSNVVVTFLLSNMQEIFLWISTKKFFQLMLALLELIEDDSTLEIRILNPKNLESNEVLKRAHFKQKIVDILKLRDFVGDVQSQLLKVDFEKLKRILFLDEAGICSTFFLSQSQVLRDLSYSFDIDQFREENITIKNMHYINKKAQSHRMSIFASFPQGSTAPPLSKSSSVQSPSLAPGLPLTKYKPSSASLLDRLADQNIAILQKTSLYKKLRLVVQNNRRIYMSRPFQQLLQFLFRSLIRFLKSDSKNLKNAEIEGHFHLLINDCGDLNVLISILLEETQNFGFAVEMLGWVSQSPNDVFLRILIDKFSQVVFEFTRKETSKPNAFSRQRLLSLLHLENPLQSDVCVALVKLYEAHLQRKTHMSEPTQTKVVKPQTYCKGEDNLNILTLMFYLRSELRRLIDQTSESSPDSLLNVGRFLISGPASDTQSRVRNSVLIYLLGSLQEKVGFLDNQLSKFRPLLPDSLLNSQMHCLRVYNDQMLRENVLPLSKLLRRLSRGEDLGDVSALTNQDFYSLAVSIINQQLTHSKDKNSSKGVFTHFKASMNPYQALFLETVIQDFPSSEDISLTGPQSEEYLTHIILFILNVTLSTISSFDHLWFLPRLLQDLTAGITSRIPFNFKNVLLIDSSMNRLINKNNSSAKLYECVNCGTPFSIGDCGNPVLLEKAAKCVNCKEEIGAQEFHKPNENTREISFEEFRKKSLSSPLYSVHEYLLDETVTMDGLPRFGFRVGHLLSHALYAGLTLTGLLDCPSLLLPSIDTSHPHLKLSERNKFEYFYKHVKTDLDWLKKELRINELPVEFLGYLLQDVVCAPSFIPLSEDLAKVQGDFASLAEGYRTRLAQIGLEIRGKRGKTVSQEVVSEDAIKRNVDFEEVEDDVDRFLFLNLRQTADLNLLLFSSSLKGREGKFEKLSFYLDHVVGKGFYREGFLGF